jgi:hypothetical protein
LKVKYNFKYNEANISPLLQKAPLKAAIADFKADGVFCASSMHCP